MKPIALLLTAALVPLCLFAAGDPPVVPLWANGAPGSKGATDKEVYESATPQRNYSRLYRIHDPAVEAYLPATEQATGAAVIICPGGAPIFLTIDHEGRDAARWFNRIGVAAFVLKFRLAQTEGANYTVDTSVSDALRAVRLVRSRAAEWNIDPKRIGLMGFSGGGAVAAIACTHFNAGDSGAADPVERQSSRPDFQVLVYPGAGADLPGVPKDAPPAFLVSAYDDRVPGQVVARLYLKLREAGVLAELHVYANGGHGFGMRESALPVATWNVRLREWMNDLKLLARQ